MTVQTPSETSSPPEKQERQRPRIVIGVVIVLIVIGAYALSLFGVHLLQKSEGPLPPLDISQAGPDETVVQIRLEELKSTTNRLTVNVLIYPGESLEDKRFDELNTDIAVRLYPPNDLGDLKYPAGKAPAQVSTTIQAHGDPGAWPFDSYQHRADLGGRLRREWRRTQAAPGSCSGDRSDGRLGRERHPQQRHQ